MNITQNPSTLHNKNTALKTVDFRVKYKTEKCRYWEQQGFCPFGQTCAFAHDCLEIRYKGQIHDRYKTKPCLNFSKYGSCKYGDRCLFLHMIQVSDRERTRSNSPVQETVPVKPVLRHQQNLKILTQFGFSVFQAHMKRDCSRLLNPHTDQECKQKSVSTEPQLNLNVDNFDYDYNYDPNNNNSCTNFNGNYNYGYQYNYGYECSGGVQNQNKVFIDQNGDNWSLANNNNKKQRMYSM